MAEKKPLHELKSSQFAELVCMKCKESLGSYFFTHGDPIQAICNKCNKAEPPSEPK
ncbi:MAG: hypothetical protein ACE5IR_11790 [bacterium]